MKRVHFASLLLAGAMAVTVGCSKERAENRSNNAGNDATTAQTGGPDNVNAPANDRAMSDTTNITDQDRSFVQEAAQGGLMEVQLGQTALEKAASDDVRQFARRMVDDHGQANQELKQIASAKQLQVPSSLDQQHQEMVSRLGKLSGKAFDQAYMREMVKDHTKDLAEFRTAANSTKDSALKDFTSRTAQTIEQHLQLARDTASKVGGAQSGKQAEGQ